MSGLALYASILKGIPNKFKILLIFKKLVEVFKTNINSRKIAKKIQKCLEEAFPGYRLNFDLQDCDKILRVEAQSLDCEKIIALIKSHSNDILISILDE